MRTLPHLSVIVGQLQSMSHNIFREPNLSKLTNLGINFLNQTALGFPKRGGGLKYNILQSKVGQGRLGPHRTWHSCSQLSSETGAWFIVEVEDGVCEDGYDPACKVSADGCFSDS